MPPPFAILRRLSPLERELLRLRDELSALRRTLATRERTLSRHRDQLISFEGRYLRQVGLLLKQLDSWEQKRAALHERPDADLPTEDPAAPADAADPPPASLDLRRLFREVAKRLHPDRATDAADEHRRTRLMAQANDAFLRHDRNVLERMLHGFDVAPAHNDTAAQIAEARLHLRQVRADIAAAEAELAQLTASDTARLQRDTLAAALAGRDLLAEMANRIRGRIGLAMRAYELDLDRIRRPPRGLAVEDLLSAEPRPKPIPRFDAKRQKWAK